MFEIERPSVDEMFALAGVNKAKLYNALRAMGKKNLKSQFRAEWSIDNPTRNYCYVIAEWASCFILKDATGWKLEIPGDLGLHRFLTLPDGTIIDLAVEQFKDQSVVDYSKAVRCGFMYPSPSKRARLLNTLMNV